jgi:hypothetical protein
MPSEQPKSDVSDDIFSLSDRVLAEKLLFVKEVRFPIQTGPARRRTPALTYHSDWFWKLGQCLVMPTESVKWERHEAGRETCAPIQDNHDGRSCPFTVSSPFHHTSLHI